MTTTLGRAVEVKDVVTALQGFKLSQTELAKATGASERSVRNWKKTSGIRPQYEERLRDVREVALILQDSLTPRGVGQWLRARNRLLRGKRPLEMIARGKVDEVVKAAQAFVGGAYV
jgi:hypothetical protein